MPSALLDERNTPAAHVGQASGDSYESDLNDAVAEAAYAGLTATAKWLTPWLFYDERGSELFERITELPEYYLTRTERALFVAHADEIIAAASGGERLTLAELGAGTATKTGILLRAAVARQGSVLYQPVDVSPSALEEAARLERDLPGVTVRPSVANYITSQIVLERPMQSSPPVNPNASAVAVPHGPKARPERILALYIGSSIGNFSPEEARGILHNLRAQLVPGDSLLLGTDLAPGATKTEAELIAAYDDAAGVTAAFNRNVLVRLNRELGADFDLPCFAHEARWNPEASRMEMHLRSLRPQVVTLARVAGANGRPLRISFASGETIHTEDSYKFSTASLDRLLGDCGFDVARRYTDAEERYAVTLASAVQAGPFQ
jgi:L-histidine N-alpha-methyltransferase